MALLKLQTILLLPESGNVISKKLKPYLDCLGLRMNSPATITQPKVKACSARRSCLLLNIFSVDDHNR